MKRFRFISLILLGAMAWLTAMPTSALQPSAPEGGGQVSIQFLNISDWHSQLDSTGAGAAAVGGAAVLSAYFQQDRASNPNTLTLHAGDAFGATPTLSYMFNEEPGVKAMRMMGVQVDTFGNHNFDRGLNHLQKMIDRAGAPTAPLSPGLPFKFVAANLANTAGALGGFSPYEIFTIAGVKVAVIGIVNPEAPTLVKPGSFGPITITDPVAAANTARTAAAAQGAQVFVIITHMGITGTSGGQPSGPLVSFANQLTGFDYIFGDHTDVKFQSTINGALVTENRSKGAEYIRATLVYDTSTNTVVSKNAVSRVPLANGVTPDANITNMLAPYRAQLRAILDPTIAVATNTFPRGGTPAVERIKEVAIGNLVTDALRAKYGAQIAFTNGGGLRTPLPSAYAPANTALRRNTTGYAPGPPWDLVVGDIYEVLPFGNQAVVRNVTGGQIWRMLEHSVAMLPAADGRFGQISGFKFTYDSMLPAGRRVLSVKLNNGTQIISNTTSTYTMVTNDFTNAGGDGYTMLADGQGTTGDTMADIVADYVRAQGVITPTVEGRISEVRNLQLLNVSDWHSQLDPTGAGAAAVGGASVLSTYWQQDRVNNPSSLTLTAGDGFGATPTLSYMFNEEPGVKAMRMMGIQVDTFGNHNFDRGVQHLQKMIDLAGAPTAPLSPGLPFQYVAANLAGTTGVLTGVAPYKIFTVNGVKIAVIGIVNPEAPDLVKPGSFGPITITDPVAAANTARTAAAGQGAQVFVILTHMGITGTSNGQPIGPLVTFANQLSGFHVILGDHTDVQFSKYINGALVTENKSKGVTYARTNIQFDLTTSTVLTETVQFVSPLAVNVTKDPAIEAMLAPYRAQLRVTLDPTIAVATNTFPRNSALERTQEAAVGDLVADALRTKYGAQIAFTNGGGLRSPLPSPYAPANTALRRPAAGYAAGPPWDLVVGDIYEVLPFGNQAVVRPVTGSILWQALEHSVARIPLTDGRFGQISGFKFTYDPTRAAGSRVLSVQLNNGTPILPDATTYTMVTNDFTNAGGDGYTMFVGVQGTVGNTMADDVAEYVRNQGTISPNLDGRINALPTITNIADQTISEDGATGVLTFTIGDIETAPASLTVTAVASNGALVPQSAIRLGGAGANRTIAITPTADLNGTSVITVTVADAFAGTRADSFVLTVNAVNDAPTIGNIADQTINEDTSTGAIPFAVGDLETAPASLTVTAAASNSTLVPAGAIRFGGAGATRTIAITPAANLSGTSVITVTVSDGQGGTRADSFLLTVNPVNDAPTISAIADQTVRENGTLAPVSFTLADIDSPAAGLTVTASSSDVTLIPNNRIVISGSGLNRTVSLTPTLNRSGTATITLTVSDGGANATRTFQVTVQPFDRLYLPLLFKPAETLRPASERGR
ncbi:MAG TPA: 5'-nucleotidase C-terminal domain-containing protein [Herpetosiphonaceae bacterium]